MANTIVTLICVGMLLASVGVMAQGSFTSMKTLSESWKEMEVRSNDIARTELQVASGSRSAPYVYITVRSVGSTPLLNFEAWDVVVLYYDDADYYQKWLPYTASNPPGDNQWTVVGIYRDSGATLPEVFQPGILDPDEYASIRIRLNPSFDNGDRAQVIIGTPNGVTVSRQF